MRYKAVTAQQCEKNFLLNDGIKLNNTGQWFTNQDESFPPHQVCVEGTLHAEEDKYVLYKCGLYRQNLARSQEYIFRGLTEGFGNDAYLVYLTGSDTKVQSYWGDVEHVASRWVGSEQHHESLWILRHHGTVLVGWTEAEHMRFGHLMHCPDGTLRFFRYGSNSIKPGLFHYLEQAWIRQASAAEIEELFATTPPDGWGASFLKFHLRSKRNNQ